MGPAMRWKCLSAARQKREILEILHHNNNNSKIFSSISSDEIPPQFISIGSYSPEVRAFGTLITSTKVFLLII